jgi:N-acetylmuramoyl-L-alanine amidase
MIKYIFIHHSAVSYNLNPDQWTQTNNYHRDVRGFPKSSLGFYVGYSYEISKDGLIRQARNDGEETAAVKGYNFESISICLDGNFDIELPTPMQSIALKNLLKEKMKAYNVPIKNILPHRAFANKSCYGSKLPDDWGQKLVEPLDNLSAFEKLRALFRQYNISTNTPIALSSKTRDNDYED